MKNRRNLGIIPACLLALSLTACGNADTRQGSDAAQGAGSGSAIEMSEASESSQGDAARKEPKKDEPALDWSAVETAPEEDFYFTDVSIGPEANAVKGVKVKEYLGEGGVVKVPNSYRDLPVIMIERDAFKESGVTDLYFETEGFVYVKEWAFRDCTTLNSVVIKGNEKTEIREKAFEGCTSLTSVVMSEEITDFDSRVFEDTLWLANRQQEDPLVIINNTVVDGTMCTGDVVIPDGVVRIAPDAFNGNADITSVTLPDSIRRIEWQAFALCTSLTDVNIPDNAESIADAFKGSENVVLTWKGKKYGHDKLKELEGLIREQ